jgi:uncharacterized protein (TIGR02452 family)
MIGPDWSLPMTKHFVLPCEDTDELASRCCRDLDMAPDRAAALGNTAVQAAREGRYQRSDGSFVDISTQVEAAVRAKRSIRPSDALPTPPREPWPETRVGVANRTTLAAARRLFDAGARPLALNFANGVVPGGGFLRGARAQEEVLCRSSALYATLEGDPMYQAHRLQGNYESSAWAILSPYVPVFRSDDGTSLDAPWPLTVLTCAAPVAEGVGQPRSGDLLAARILRVLAVARGYGYQSLVLGAWGCGAFGNDPVRTAGGFRDALAEPFRGAFSEVVFAVTDWSPERRFLGPFRDAMITLA